jgi:hypothetical protein
MKVLKPPTPLINIDCSKRTIFLAGSIEMGAARDWQTEVEESLVDLEGVLFNPRRDDWDSSWKQSIDNFQFRQQVEWELKAQEMADTVLFHFEPGTQSPITLLELGLFVEKAVVHCPDGYWRKGNVDVVCNFFGVPQVNTLDELIANRRVFRCNRINSR